MKKIVIYAAVLLGVFWALSVLDQQSDYIVEKKIWKTYRQQIDIARDPNVIPERNFEQVLEKYRRIIEQHPHSILVPGIRIHIGEMYALKKDYQTARRVFQELIALYPDDKELIAEAMFKIGKTYETAGQWTAAYDMYRKIISGHPLTKVGLEVPKYIADYHKKQNDFQNTMNAYEFAIGHYKHTASAHEGSRAGLDALHHLSRCYLDQNRWMEAVDTLGLILEKYSTSNYLNIQNIEMIIKTINITAAYQIKDYDVAIRLYEGIITRNPRHPLEDYLKKVIDAFEQLKAKGVQVSER